MREMDYVQEMIGDKQQKPNTVTTPMKLCPLCNLNFIEEDKACCSICEDSQPRPIIIGSTAKIGDTIYARTHADFLNQLLSTNYKSYMKSSLHLSDGKLLWMIELGSFVSPSGWINRLESNLIRESHVGPRFEYGHNTYKRALEMRQYFDSSDRVIFDIVKTGQGRKYIFRGVFRLNREQCTYNENVWELALSEYKLK